MINLIIQGPLEILLFYFLILVYKLGCRPVVRDGVSLVARREAFQLLTPLCCIFLACKRIRFAADPVSLGDAPGRADGLVVQVRAVTSSSYQEPATRENEAVVSQQMGLSCYCQLENAPDTVASMTPC